MVLAAVAALGCALAARPRRIGAVLAAVIMLAAMVDMALCHVLLAPVPWAAVLAVLGVFVVALPRATGDSCSWHHGLALVAAAVIMLIDPHTLPLADAAGDVGVSRCRRRCAR